MKTVAPPASDDTCGTLSVAVAPIAGASDLPGLLSALRELVTTRFGALGADILGSDTRRFAIRARGARGAGVLTASQWLSNAIRHGETLRVEADEAAFTELAAPPDATGALIVPGAGEQPCRAICVYLGGASVEPHPAMVAELRIVALVAGLAAGRAEAAAREHARALDADSRVRNLQSLVRSVAKRSAENTTSLEDFVEHFEGRLDAIGRSQLSTGSDRTSFEMLLRDELLAQSIIDGPSVTMNGIDANIAAEHAASLGIGIHELAVNAQKYGAFAGNGGRLAIGWWPEHAEDGSRFVLSWRETFGDPLDDEPQHFGFGRTVIERLIPFELDADVVYRLGRDGLLVRISIPFDPRQNHDDDLSDGEESAGPS